MRCAADGRVPEHRRHRLVDVSADGGGRRGSFPLFASGGVLYFRKTDALERAPSPWYPYHTWAPVTSDARMHAGSPPRSEQPYVARACARGAGFFQFLFRLLQFVVLLKRTLTQKIYKKNAKCDFKRKTS